MRRLSRNHMPRPWRKLLMDKIRTLVVDDELPARRRVLDLLEKQNDIEVTGMARDGREAVAQIRNSRPDLMFLDIQMPNLDGFGVLQEVGQKLMPVTIFVTAYDAFAIRAFDGRLIGARVEARLYLDHVEVWYGQRKVEDLPRLRGRS